MASSYFFPPIRPNALTDKAWFLTYENSSYASIDALEKEEEAHAANLAKVANTPAPEPIGSKIMAAAANASRRRDDDDDDDGDERRSVGNAVHRMRRRRRRHRVAGVGGAGTATPSRTLDEDSYSEDNSTVVASRTGGTANDSSFQFDRTSDGDVNVSRATTTGEESAFSIMEEDNDETMMDASTDVSRFQDE